METLDGAHLTPAQQAMSDLWDDHTRALLASASRRAIHRTYWLLMVS